MIPSLLNGRQFKENRRCIERPVIPASLDPSLPPATSLCALNPAYIFFCFCHPHLSFDTIKVGVPATLVLISK